MPAWGWVLVALAVVAAVAVVAWQTLRKRRSARLRDRFGPEYDRVAEVTGSTREAEAELGAREERRQRLEIRPLPEAARSRYLRNWRVMQAQFVDDPKSAVASADGLIQSVMADRGYPVEDFEQRAADISVDHPQVVENYRLGHRLATAATNDGGSTEDLRQAMRHYRALFDELVEPDADQPLAAEGERAGTQPVDVAPGHERTVR